MGHANCIGGQLFGTFDVPEISIDDAQFKFGARELIIVLLAFQHLQDFLELGLCLRCFARPEQQHAALENYFDQTFMVGQHLIYLLGAFEGPFGVVRISFAAVGDSQMQSCAGRVRVQLSRFRIIRDRFI